MVRRWDWSLTCSATRTRRRCRACSASDWACRRANGCVSRGLATPDPRPRSVEQLPQRVAVAVGDAFTVTMAAVAHQPFAVDNHVRHRLAVAAEQPAIDQGFVVAMQRRLCAIEADQVGAGVATSRAACACDGFGQQRVADMTAE